MAASHGPGIGCLSGKSWNFLDEHWGDNAVADLAPNRTYEWGYLTSEVAGEPERWRDLLGWSQQIERWLAVAAGNRGGTDAFVMAVRELELADQLYTGLTWIEQIVHGDGDGCARTFTLPEWLRERRADLNTPEQQAR